MSDNLPQDNLRAFLDALWDLSQKHGFFIEGCGCCGSPFLTTNIRPGLDCYVVDDQGDNLKLSPRRNP